MPLLSEGASSSVVSSVLVCFFQACNTFTKAPSGFPTDTALIMKDDRTACISPQLYAPVTQSRSQQTFKCQSERRNIHPNLKL
uniref:Uncharacterized protein n=1 Tax=Rhinopithecus roxellana TaxID=61622 RepID=A0A2K6PWY4_RHIRO